MPGSHVSRQPPPPPIGTPDGLGPAAASPSHEAKGWPLRLAVGKAFKAAAYATTSRSRYQAATARPAAKGRHREIYIAQPPRFQPPTPESAIFPRRRDRHPPNLPVFPPPGTEGDVRRPCRGAPPGPVNSGFRGLRGGLLRNPAAAVQCGALWFETFRRRV